MNYKTILISSLLCAISFLSHGMETKPTQKDIDKANNNLWQAVMDKANDTVWQAEIDLQNVKRLISEGIADVNIVDHCGNTPLIYAAKRNNTGIINALINAKVNVNSADKNGTTALMYAAQHANRTAVNALIKANADVNSVDNDGCTALIYAAKNKYMNTYIDEVNTLIKRKKCIFAEEKEPLLLNVYSAYTNMIYALIKAGADLNMVDTCDKTALMYIEQNTDIKPLTKAGFTIHTTKKYQDIALKHSIRNGNFDMSLQLLNPTTAFAQKKIKTLLAIYNKKCFPLSDLPKELLQVIVILAYPAFAINTNVHPQVLVDTVPLETLSLLIQNGTLNHTTILEAWNKKIKSASFKILSNTHYFKDDPYDDYKVGVWEIEKFAPYAVKKVESLLTLNK